MIEPFTIGPNISTWPTIHIHEARVYKTAFGVWRYRVRWIESISGDQTHVSKPFSSSAEARAELEAFLYRLRHELAQ